jgi:hypothetical protein
MAERPILFSAPMVRALLAGQKTQTRRVAKCSGYDLGGFAFTHLYDQPNNILQASFETLTPRDDGIQWVSFACPYGKPGDRLYVRETWRSTGDGGRADYLSPNKMQPHKVWYDADGPAPADECVGKTRVSIHMPRWASRILLEIVSVRVERLRDITEADIYSEGAITEEWLEWREDANNIGMPSGSTIESERDVWQRLWSSINGSDSWDANPFVWVVEFKRVAA